jgi:hypothetical protein
MQRDYKFLIPAVRIIKDYQAKNVNVEDEDYIETIWSLKQELETVLQFHDEQSDEVREVSKLVISKIILGTLGLTIAYDTFVCKGLKCHSMTKKSLQEVQQFAIKYKDTIMEIQQHIRDSKKSKVVYPFMRIIDMYFWNVGKNNAT